MAKYCRYCGKPLTEGADFCMFCGKPVRKDTGFCMHCGKPVAEDAEFCMFCGKPLPKTQDAPAQKAPVKAPRAVPAQQAPVKVPQTAPAQQAPVAVPQTSPALRNAAPAAPLQQHPSVRAAKEQGEILLGELELAGDPAAEAVKGPLGGILRAAGSWLGGIAGVFRKKYALAGTVLIAVLWGALWFFRDSDSQIVKILSFLTFSEGGLDRAFPGMIGGALGKGTVAAAVVSLFNGGMKSLFKGIGALFTGHGEKRSAAGVIFGFLTGAALYLFFCGMNASLSTAMAGIAGAVLSLEAMGSGRGKLFELVGSLTSRTTDGIRSVVRSRCDGVLAGLTLGFSLAAALASFGILEVIA